MFQTKGNTTEFRSEASNQMFGINTQQPQMFFEQMNNFEGRLNGMMSNMSNMSNMGNMGIVSSVPNMSTVSNMSNMSNMNNLNTEPQTFTKYIPGLNRRFEKSDWVESTVLPDSPVLPDSTN